MATARTRVERPAAGGGSKGKGGAASTAKASGTAKANASVAPKGRPVATGPVAKAASGRGASGGAAGSRQDTSIDGLTKQFREVLASWNDADAGSRVRAGEVLSQAKAKLEHGAWLGWVDAHVPYKRRWVQITMELAAWSRDNPATFGRVRGLGSEKATELMRLRPDQLEVLLSRREHVVPSTGERVSLAAMTVAELREVLKALTGKQPKGAESAIDGLIKQAQGSAKKAIESIKWLIANKGAVSPELVEDFHDELAHWLGELEDAFGLEGDV